MAFASWGRSFTLPLSTSTYSASTLPFRAVRTVRTLTALHPGLSQQFLERGEHGNRLSQPDLLHSEQQP
jgi:hypothetical protein